MPRPAPVPDGAERPLTPGMRRLLVVAGVLVTLAGIPLFVFPHRTDVWFAWTIGPPMTAVFLGAAYWSAAAIEWGAARRRTWAEARIAVPGVLLFTTLTLVVTLAHLDRFHTGPEHHASARVVTGAWIAIYAVVPVLMAVLWWRQGRLAGTDAPPRVPLPPLARAMLVLQAAVLVPLGTGLLVAPTATAALWPWPLTPLTARAIGAWLVSLGVVAGHALLERAVERIRPALVGSVVFAALQALALVRHQEDIDNGAAAAAYAVVLATFALTGASAWRAGMRGRTP